MNLKQLFAELDASPCPPTLRLLTRSLRKLRVSRGELGGAVRFGRHTYRRNLLHDSPQYQALVLCWRSGQRSPIHDHRGSACGVRVIEGVATEVIFDRSPAGLIYPVRTLERAAASVCASFDADMHQMGNLQAARHDLITLHIYAPPLLAMRTYFLGDSVTGEDARARVAAIRARAIQLGAGPLPPRLEPARQ